MALTKSIKLSSGFSCPLLGYGTWQSKDPAKLKVALKCAIESGYRHIDTAYYYGNEAVIGEALLELYDCKLVKREDVFIATKLASTFHRPDKVVDVLRKEVADLKTSYVDLYLIHFPVPTVENADGTTTADTETKMEDTWKAMEACVTAGLARSIGVSNFNIKQIQRLLDCGKVKPAMNQVESNPGFQNSKLIEFCQKNGVAVTAFSAFGSPGTISAFSGTVICDKNWLEDKTLFEIGQKYGKTAAQVILRWQIQRNVVVIPKSITPARIVDNAKVFDFELSSDDMKSIAALDTNIRYFKMAFPQYVNHPEFPFTEQGSC